MADDFLTKKKESGPLLDLSKATVNSKEEFRKLLDKLPDYKIKPVKVRTEEIKIRDKDFKFKTGKRDLRILKETFSFQDAMPPEMKGVKLEDLYPVPIDWRMLTTQRPKLRQDEDFFSRMVELGKAQMRTLAKDKRSLILDPSIRKSKNKSGVIETRAVSCVDCGEEFCDGKTCCLFNYDCFSRVPVELKAKKAEKAAAVEHKPKKIKRRSRSKTKTKRAKSKSPVKSRKSGKK